MAEPTPTIELTATGASVHRLPSSCEPRRRAYTSAGAATTSCTATRPADNERSRSATLTEARAFKAAVATAVYLGEYVPDPEDHIRRLRTKVDRGLRRTDCARPAPSDPTRVPARARPRSIRRTDRRRSDLVLRAPIARVDPATRRSRVRRVDGRSRLRPKHHPRQPRSSQGHVRVRIRGRPDPVQPDVTPPSRRRRRSQRLERKRMPSPRRSLAACSLKFPAYTG